jgi:hypothetical protein
MKSYSERYIELNDCYKQGIDCHLEETNIDIRFFHFNSFSCSGQNENLPADNRIDENFSFEYPVFFPAEKKNTARRYCFYTALTNGTGTNTLPGPSMYAMRPTSR